MKEYTFKFSTHPVTLEDCPIGLFVKDNEICLKTEYSDNEGRIDAYIVSSGECFWGGARSKVEQRKVLVYPSIGYTMKIIVKEMNE
jgi:hypothetical protein